MADQIGNFDDVSVFNYSLTISFGKKGRLVTFAFWKKIERKGSKRGVISSNHRVNLCVFLCICYLSVYCHSLFSLQCKLRPLKRAARVNLLEEKKWTAPRASLNTNEASKCFLPPVSFIWSVNTTHMHNTRESIC